MSARIFSLIKLSIVPLVRWFVSLSSLESVIFTVHHLLSLAVHQFVISFLSSLESVIFWVCHLSSLSFFQTIIPNSLGHLVCQSINLSSSSIRPPTPQLVWTSVSINLSFPSPQSVSQSVSPSFPQSVSPLVCHHRILSSACTQSPQFISPLVRHLCISSSFQTCHLCSSSSHQFVSLSILLSYSQFISPYQSYSWSSA